ncbi:hypothetical protein XJ44_03345 [Thermosipho affectus]|uniref:Type I phosphodiesterase/nucleotide pyrophosphatase n=1 Tax=Thermosipho affectus TaxID=660294 RepID=A0ABX3II39_9BACT|nr:MULTISPECIES: alkaline phosphatase family protein [Thermosipho]ANQ53547.1 phosphodiesterase [Thermosipho sp. 1070]APT71995.1 phosphodiesterase [Thermosipho sp. 1063]ONN27501.1 hypothetical protein XJ44_03345 [Thermosipho affectus]OOC44664.1 hypothetical protein XO08_03395 [Thermosipho sp. 1074]
MKPVYEKSIVSFVNVLLKHFGVSPYHEFKEMEEYLFPFLEKKEKIIVVILDSLGFKKFKELGVIFENYTRLSSVFPTTTVAAVTSIMTGLTPKEHGLLGYVQFLREIGTLVNMIDFSFPGMSENSFATLVKKNIKRLPNVFQLLKKEGLYGGVLTAQNIANSGLSFLIQNNANVLTYYSTLDMLVKLERMLRKDFKGILFTYYGTIDGIGHKMGPDSDSYEYEAKYILEWFKKLNADKKTRIFILADHGMITTPNEKNKFMGSELLKFLKIPPAGEMRMMYFYVQKNKKERFLEYMEEKYSGKFEIYPSKECLMEGYFGIGKAHPETVHRIGDYVLICKDNYSFTYTYTGGEQKLKGMHGSLSYEELFVPLIII